ncbi:hypothetical protein LY474_08060 [Myxococcus stipitatus]|uniref:hypothetical protein n=1 Tax=Myxococcus stipitatus TaxID=83455 RepID=UPI001F167007|nr:hypothetical protein [Myxococcus stipitatus]MCE9667765.1 hypothetical protein [Myxococcus stipitatus]
MNSGEKLQTALSRLKSLIDPEDYGCDVGEGWSELDLDQLSEAFDHPIPPTLHAFLSGGTPEGRFSPKREHQVQRAGELLTRLELEDWKQVQCVPIIEMEPDEDGQSQYLAVSLEEPEGPLRQFRFGPEFIGLSPLTLLGWIELVCDDLETHEYPPRSLMPTSLWEPANHALSEQDLIELPPGAAFLVKQQRKSQYALWALYAKVAPEAWAVAKAHPLVVKRVVPPEFRDRGENIHHMFGAVTIATNKLHFSTRRAPGFWKKDAASVADALAHPRDFMWRGAVAIEPD